MRAPSRAVALPRTIARVLVVAAIIAAPIRAQAPVRRTAQGAWGGKTNGSGHYADVNGIKLYYEIHGTGRPLILLHGGLGALEMFGPNLPALAQGRQVIAVDLQGHGRTADIDRPLSVALMADDIAALAKRLGLESFDVMGYSMGGGVALQAAIRHPERSEEHTSELQSRLHLVCRLLLEKKKNKLETIRLVILKMRTKRSNYTQYDADIV